MRRSIAPSSAGAASYLRPSSAAFITIIVDSNFRYTHEHAGRGLAQVRLDRRIDRQNSVLVLDEVAEVGVLLVANLGLQRDRKSSRAGAQEDSLFHRYNLPASELLCTPPAGIQIAPCFGSHLGRKRPRFLLRMKF